MTHLKCTIQWLLYIHRVVQPWPQSILEHFITSKRNLTSLNYHFPNVPSQPQATSNQLLSLLLFLLSHWVLSNSVIPRTAACQASLSFTISWSLLQFMSVELVMLPNHLILCHPLLLLPSIFHSIRIFSNESALHIR